MPKLWLPEGYAPIEAFGLDLDGLLRDTGHHAYRACCHLIRERGGKPPSYGEYLRNDVGDPLLFFERYGVAFTSWKELDEAYYAVLEPEHEVPPFRDVAGFLEAMVGKGLNLFVVTASPEKWATSWFKDHKLDHHFGRVYHTANAKDVHIKEWCADFEVAPEQVAYVGDRPSDVFAAIKATCIPIGMTRGYEGADRVLRESGAKLVVQTLEHLTHLVS